MEKGLTARDEELEELEEDEATEDSEDPEYPEEDLEDPKELEDFGFEHLSCSVYKLWQHKHSPRSERNHNTFTSTRVPVNTTGHQHRKMVYEATHSFPFLPFPLVTNKGLTATKTHSAFFACSMESR
ncbi:hypothetical protein TYRP_009537 [Tyrophagus putrescentiae]|nr:hypothetical protein TYRP_009537 [Tyrophagus putrescentiae]